MKKNCKRTVQSDACIQQLKMTTELESLTVTKQFVTSLKIATARTTSYHDKQPNHTSSIWRVFVVTLEWQEVVTFVVVNWGHVFFVNAETQPNNAVDTRGINLQIFKGEPGCKTRHFTQQHDQVLYRLILVGIGFVLQHLNDGVLGVNFELVLLAVMQHIVLGSRRACAFMKMCFTLADHPDWLVTTQ